MNYIIQINQQDVERSNSLENKDIGKWCILMNGCYNGFWDTREEAEYCFHSYFVR